jgi:signal transduction histidine kinase
VAKSKIPYPWASVILGVIIVTYLLATSSEEITVLYAIPSVALRWDYKLVAVAVFVLVLLLDTVRFFKRLSAYDLRVAQYEDQVQELLRAKKDLQTRAHKYSRHADKLKLFISDRLLEYIEYDERFLHFKSIAAEVRHNGVISYDKVQTVLREAIDEAVLDDKQKFSDALRSLTYFWDLLDLATTDNIAMHIANKTYECEEHFYRSQLNDEEDIALPFSPTFSARQTLLTALAPFVQDSHRLASGSDESQATIRYTDATYWVAMEDAGELLGNENHLILLAENLVNNALSYADKGAGKNKYARIAVLLTQKQDNAQLSVYNRGPHIDEAHREQIFQLGFSTKRGRENRGKGLGLYFVNEIVRGYEGGIEFTNVTNRGEAFSLRVQLMSGETHTQIVITEVTDNGLLCKLGSDGKADKKIEWKFAERIDKLEISPQSTGDTHACGDFDDGTSNLLDPQQPWLPRWALEVSNRKKSCRLVFLPLDVAGVRFDVTLPTAAARLDYDSADADEDEFDDVDSLQESFKEMSEFD